MIWAADTNSFVCSTVMPNGPDALTNQELSGAYYQSAIPVVQKQIAKAGYRLAAWLDAIVAASEQTSAEDIAYPADSSPAKAIRGPPYAKREFKLEPWMEEARAARREFGPDCGCGEEDHAH